MQRLAWLAAGPLLLGLAAPAQVRTCAEMEQFLKTAAIGDQRSIPIGVTAPRRASLVAAGGDLKHDASIQTTNVSKTSFQTQRGAELNFRDFYGFNIAGYELAKMLELNMVPPYIERKVGGTSGSLSWWINDAMMEVDRLKRKRQPPDPEAWNKQMYAARVFNQLIANMDDNLTNLLITRDWQIWMIDFTRAFRTVKTLPNPKNLVQCDRKLLAKLKELDRATLEQKLVKTRYLTRLELDGVLARRDKIVEFFDKEIAAKGETAVLYDLPRSGQPCGVGL